MITTDLMSQLGGFHKIRPLLTPAGRPAARQYILQFELGEIVQSYDSVVLLKRNGRPAILGQDWDYSSTTRKYVAQHLRTSVAQLRDEIAQGYIKCDARL